MHIPLCEATRRMTEQTRDRELGEPEIASDASEGVAKDMGRDTLKFRFRAYAVEDPNDAGEMAVSPIRRKDERRTVTIWQRLDTGHRGFSQNADLRTALGIRKADAVFPSTEPEPLQAQDLHSPKSCQKHQ